MNNFSEKSVLITGCSSGIGLDAALSLKSLGYRVFATARTHEDVQKLVDLGLNAHVLDLNNTASINNAMDWVLRQTEGTLYGLFNNGAYGQPGAIEDLPTEALREQFETNVFGWHELTRRVIPVMRQQGYGRIVHNSSVLGFVCMPFRGAYNASKYAMEALADTLRLELHSTGIKVVLIEPGPIESRFRANALLKFTQWIDVNHSVYQQAYQTQIQRLSESSGSNSFTLPPSSVTNALIKALSSNNPKSRYRVTFPTRLFALLKRLISTGMLDRLLLKG